jgi:hypothetical protein
VVETEVKEATEPGSSWSPATTQPVSEAEEATVVHSGWVPQPPPEAAPLESPALGAVGEYRWDAYQQEWVAATEPAPTPAPSEEEPVPDVATAAGVRGAATSWTTADGQRLRWDARAQRWVTEPAEPPT